LLGEELNFDLLTDDLRITISVRFSPHINAVATGISTKICGRQRSHQSKQKTGKLLAYTRDSDQAVNTD
ncbi:hypothetical protein T11_5676, partial [Trichinella zimbabwensis]